MISKKFLIIGSKGLLGSEIIKYLKKRNFSYSTISRKNSNFNLNLEKYKKLNKFFKKNKFKFVINCAAIINIDICERNYFEAKIINSYLPKFLSKLSKKYNFKLIQISTDAFYYSKIFKLNKEKDKLFAINKYAKTKLAAENFVTKNKRSLIIRTNFTGREYVKNSKRFSDWVYNSIKAKKKMLLFNDMYTSTLDVKNCARFIVDLTLKESRGIYNLGTRDAISKKQFAVKFSKKIKKKLIFKEINCINNTITPRNLNLGMNVSKIEKKLNRKMISSNQAIANLAKDYL